MILNNAKSGKCNDATTNKNNCEEHNVRENAIAFVMS